MLKMRFFSPNNTLMSLRGVRQGWTTKQSHFLITLLMLLLISCISKDDLVETRNRGLIGAYYGNDDFTNIKEAEILSRLDQQWDEETGHGSSWSGIWQGMLISPATGDIEIELVCSKSAHFRNWTIRASSGRGSIRAVHLLRR